jgi:hypothetical protein
MDPGNLKQSLIAGTAPKQVRMLIAERMVPLPSGELMELLVFLLKDQDPEVKDRAANTLNTWDREEMCLQLTSPDCHPSILEYFAQSANADRLQQAILSNPSTPDTVVSSLALTVPASLLETILDNRARIIKFPHILASIRRNPASTSEILRLVHEIEVDFGGRKKTEYAVGEVSEPEVAVVPTVELQFDVPAGDLSLEGLPVEGEARETEIVKRLSTMPMREKMRYALFGNREIRSVLIRDSNKEVARSVLRSPKITDSEIEAITAMRGVTEDILREIGQSRSWTKSYTIVHNLVKNPKTPPTISQNLLFRLRSPDLLLLSKDRSVSDAVRYNANRALHQRSKRPAQ